MKPRTKVQLQVEELEGRVTPSTTTHVLVVSSPGVIIDATFTTTPGDGADGASVFGNPLNPVFPGLNNNPFPPGEP